MKRLFAVALLGCVAFLCPPLSAAPVPVEPKKDPPKKVQPDDLPIPNLPDLFPPGIDQEEMKRLQEELQRIRDELRKQAAGMRRGPAILLPNNLFGTPTLERKPKENRLGAVVEAPPPALIDQLDLPKDQGLVIQEKKDDSAASKAGFKPNDILLELDGKSIPSKVEDFDKLLKEIKADTPVDATVMRKGRRETVKGVKLPEVKAEEQPKPSTPKKGPDIQIPNLPAVVPGAGAGSVQMVRTGDTFLVRVRNNKETIAINGKMKDGKCAVEEIVVSDGKDTKKYKTVGEVPEAMRDQIKGLIELTEKSTGTIE